MITKKTPVTLIASLLLAFAASAPSTTAQEPLQNAPTLLPTSPSVQTPILTTEQLLRRLEEAEAKIKNLEAGKPDDKKAAEKKEGDDKKPEAASADCPPEAGILHRRHLFDSLHGDECYGIKSIFDSLNPQGAKGKAWYEKINLRGYTQFRFTRSLDLADDSASPNILGDRSVNGSAENFTIRRMRLILFGDVSEHLGIYIQPDFTNTPPGSTGPTFFGQLRDVYGDVYLDKEKVHRFRVGLSKVPYGFENLQSSQNRLSLDRSDPINNSDAPNERDVGVFYYFTPKDKQDLLRDLVAGGLKGSGNYGIFAIGVYDGQGGSVQEANLNLHAVVRATYPFQLESGQVVEASVQAYSGDYVVSGAAIRPLGVGGAFTPTGTGGVSGHRDQRVAGTFVWYPQPIGFQAEWSVGEGPGLADDQRSVIVRDVQGGYLQTMYKYDPGCYGIFIPYVKYQYFHGGYRSAANAPHGTTRGLNFGLEWQIRKEMELTCEYTLWDGVTLNAINQPGEVSYRNYEGSFLRLQFQINY